MNVGRAGRAAQTHQIPVMAVTEIKGPATEYDRFVDFDMVYDDGESDSVLSRRYNLSHRP